MITAHPSFDQLQMSRVGNGVRDWHLMRAPGTLQPLAVEFFRTGPSLGSAHDDHRPSRTNRIGGVAFSRMVLDLANFRDASFERRRHQLMHRLRLVARHYVRL